jgi:hypothetical protein
VDVAQPGLSIGRDISRAEATEKEIDQFISRRHRDRVATEGERQAEESWKESVRQYEARRKEANRLAWGDYFERLAASLRSRAEEYDQRAQTLMEDEPKGAA